jgi:hypothetical protein
MTNRVIIGSDPEFFIVNKETGDLVSAIPFIKGSKEKPVPLPHGGNIQSDNVAVEFATMPMKDAYTFADHMKMTLLDTMASLPVGHDLLVAPSAVFPDSQLKDPKAKQFGCMPDCCAWDLCYNEAPRHQNEKFRSCGGHIHVGCVYLDGTPVHPDSQFLLEGMGKVRMVRGMDLFHGVISTLFDHSHEAIERRLLYGKAGCHRPKDYGVEYRALSSWWTKSPNSSMLMASLVEDVIDVIISNKLEEMIDQITPDVIRNTINAGDVEKANEILETVLMAHLSDDSKYFLEECQATKESLKVNALSSSWGL